MSKPIPTRFDEGQIDTLDRIAEENVSDRTKLIRLAVDSFIGAVRKNGGRIPTREDLGAKSIGAATEAPGPGAHCDHTEHGEAQS